MTTTPPRATNSIARLLGARWRAFGRCAALHPTDAGLQCVEAHGHDGEHHAPMKVVW